MGEQLLKTGKLWQEWMGRHYQENEYHIVCCNTEKNTETEKFKLTSRENLKKISPYPQTKRIQKSVEVTHFNSVI